MFAEHTHPLCRALLHRVLMKTELMRHREAKELPGVTQLYSSRAKCLSV